MCRLSLSTDKCGPVVYEVMETVTFRDQDFLPLILHVTAKGSTIRLRLYPVYHWSRLFWVQKVVLVLYRKLERDVISVDDITK